MTECGNKTIAEHHLEHNKFDFCYVVSSQFDTIVVVVAVVVVVIVVAIFVHAATFYASEKHT